MDRLIIVELVTNTYSYQTGDQVYQALIPSFEQDQPVILDFKDVEALPTSFLNGLFAQLIDRYGMEKMKRLVRPVGMTKAQGQMIRDYVRNYDVVPVS